MRPILAILICLISLSVLTSSCEAQMAPPFGEVYDQSEVTAIYITINPDSLAQMIALGDNEHEYPAQFIFQSNGLNDTVSAIGFRLRGNTSLNAAKKSFKVSFNTFNSEGQWQDLEKMNLLATVNDPSLLRSKLAHDLFRQFGLVAARTSYTRLYINNEYRGLYLNVEHVDEQMTATHVDQQGDGNLYKCTYPADLNYISSNPDDYKFAFWGYRHYELKTNDYLDDYNDLSIFIDALNNTSFSQEPCVIPALFNIEDYLKIAAIDVLLGNWDGYIFNKNNFYLYHHQLTQQINYLPYDLDNTWGIDWVGIDWSQRNIYNWSPSGESRPLYALIMSQPQYRDQFSAHIETLCNTLFHPDTLASQITYWQNLIAPHVIDDTYYPMDFGYTLGDFASAADDGCCQHVPYGILDYIEARRSSALAQLESYTNYSFRVHSLNQRIDTNAVALFAIISGSPGSVQANYSWDGVSFMSGSMTDQDGDGIFTFVGPLFSNQSDKLYYRIIVNGTTVYPCATKEHWITRSSTGIRINEVCVVNDALNSDAYGEFDDWVEIYNSSDISLVLQNCFLSDNSENWNRWQLPDTTIAAHGFLLFWADDDLEQGRSHTNFKLSAGESLFLYRMEEGLPRLMDRAQGFSPIADATWALTEDGGSVSYITGEFQTPGFSNTLNTITQSVHPYLQAYPNPVKDRLTVSGCRNGILRDATGRSVAHNVSDGIHSVAHLAAGTYTLVDGANHVQLVIIE